MSENSIEDFNRKVNELKSHLVGKENITKSELQIIIGEFAALIANTLKKYQEK